jgi:hypothetical protein
MGTSAHAGSALKRLMSGALKSCKDVALRVGNGHVAGGGGFLTPKAIARAFDRALPGQNDLPATGPFGTRQFFANGQCVRQARKQLIAAAYSMIGSDRNGELAQWMIDPFKENRPEENFQI